MNSISQSEIPLYRAGFVQRFLFPVFLTFSVCFYSYRFLSGMGSPLTTLYDSDAPDWLRISKDVVWVAILVAGLVFSNVEFKVFARLNRQSHPDFFRALLTLVSLFVFMGLIHIFYSQSVQDTFLYWIRYPLEYVPVAFFMPIFVPRWRPLVPTMLGLGWLSIAFLFLELFSERQMGFYNRYGSILGSPNDYGVFCALFIIGLLSCARNWSHWLLLPFMVCGLALSVSRSALVGLLAGVCSLLYLRRVQIGVLVGIVLLVSIAGLLIWTFPVAMALPQLQFGLGHLSGLDIDVDNSTAMRLNELRVFQTRFGELDLAPLFFGTDYFHIESWYLALFVRTGVFGVVLWLVVMGATIVRGWRYRKLSSVHAIATSCLIAICVASAFIPYPDTFPTNLYLWLAVGTIWMPAGRELLARAFA
jgi:hypothetical protein